MISTTIGRDRKATEQRILEAVEAVLAKEGFSAIGVNKIAQQAKVDKVLIYRYFGGLPELLRAFGERGNFWPTIEELFPDLDALKAQPLSQLLEVFLSRFIDALRTRPLTIEILAMEIDTPNELSGVLDEVREEWGRHVAGVLGENEHPNSLELNINISLVLAGIQYFLIRARKTAIWSGIPIQQDEGWAAIKHGIAWLLPRMLRGQE